VGIRLLHFADLHLGVETYGRTDPQTGLSTRLLDFTRAFDFLVDHALREGVDLVVFAGDAYKTRDPTPTQQREFARRIRRLSEAGIPVFLLVGNHDLPAAAGRASSVEIFETLQVPGVVVCRRIGLYRLETRRGPVQIVGLPWITRSAVLAQDETRDLPPDELNQRIAAHIDQALGQLVDTLDPALPTVLVGHCTVTGADYGSERSFLLGRDYEVLPSVLRRPAFDYIALGHIHKYQILGAEPAIVYSGSLQRVDFSEEDEPKGFLVVDLERGRARSEFVAVPARPFRTITVRARGENPTAEVLQAIARAEIGEAIVRLFIETTPEAATRLDMTAIRRALAPAHTVATIQRRIERPEGGRGPGGPGIGDSPLQALRRYLEQRQTPPDRLETLVQYAQRLLEER